MGERKTRLKGTATKKPCVDCGELKDRFADFKPRWAGCVEHRTEHGRRYFKVGCDACKALVGGNIRQPRCVVCDKARPKKNKKVQPAAVPTVVAAVEVAAPEPVVAMAAPEPATPEPVVTAPEPEPVAVVGLDEKAPESVEIPAPEPVVVAPPPAPVEKRVRPKIASLADLSKLFDAPASDEQESAE